MIEVKVTVEGPPVGPQTASALELQRLRVQRAVDKASVKLRDNTLAAGREDISGAGKFGPRWIAGFTGDIAGADLERVLTFREAVPYWTVFERGAIIKGKPLLWIPLSYTGIKVRARDYPGRLFRVNRKSGKAPLLLSVDDKRPKYFAAESVRIPKKFHLVAIIRAEAKTFGALYRVEMAKSE